MQNRLGSREYGVGLPQNGPNPQNSRARQARLARKARHKKSGLAIRACHARHARRALERLAAFFNNQLSSLLPDVIDKVTPSGKIEAGGIDQLLKMFQGKMGA
jgi:hypothetical protein